MTHPIFDADEFPWTRSEVREFHRKLSGAVKDQATIELMYHSSAQGLPPLTAGGPEKAWHEAFVNMHNASTLRTFCNDLVQEARYARIHGVVRKILDASPKAPMTDSSDAGPNATERSSTTGSTSEQDFEPSSKSCSPTSKTQLMR